MAKKYGWIPDVPDQRDMLFRKKRSVKILDRVDLRPQCSPVQNQGELGSCTGNAIASAIEFDYIKQGQPHKDISRLFIYYLEREMEGTINEDAGAMIRDGIKACVKSGACLEELWPYEPEKFKKKPPRAAYKDAENRQVVEYRRCATFNDFLAALSEGYPVVFGFGIYESFENGNVSKSGVMPYPKPEERCLGGHAVLAVGYDLEKNIAIVKNSWGTDWGHEGFFYMPLDVIKNKNMSDDFWCITKVEVKDI